MAQAPPVPEPPPSEFGPRDELDALLKEYESVRGQADQALMGQLQALALGVAATAVLIAGVGALWAEAPLVASFALMLVVPGFAYFVLLVWATEIKKSLRASSFLRIAESRINSYLSGSPSPVLTWESHGHRYGNIIPYYLSIAISWGAMAVASFAFGALRFERLASSRHGYQWNPWWPVPIGLLILGLPAAVSMLFVIREIRTNKAERPRPAADLPGSGASGSSESTRS